MRRFLPQPLSEAADVRRVKMLYATLPTTAVATLISIFLCFVVLLGIVPLNVLKGWAAYMLSAFAMRLWLWHVFGKADKLGGVIRRWEWLFAVGALLTGAGWGALFGPLYPPPDQPAAQVFVLMLVVVVAFVGSFFLALSNVTFWLFSVPALLPTVAHYLRVTGGAHWILAGLACSAAVLLLIQRTLHRAAIQSIQRSTEAESLLAEQQAIFESSPMGIAVIDNHHVVKCNARLGDMLGRRLQDIAMTGLAQHFVSAEEARQFLADCDGAFDKGHVAHGMYRLHRADGSQFWAEFSGRRMAGGNHARSVWMIADVTLRVAGERRAQPQA